VETRPNAGSRSDNEKGKAADSSVRNAEKALRAPNGTPTGPKAGNSHAVTISRQEYDALLTKSKECDVFHNDYLRAHADFENLKKRLEREKLEFMKFAKEEFVVEFMPILDSVEMAMRHIERSKDAKALQDGLGMIKVQIEKFLKDLGVEKVKAAGERFDPHVHDAVEVVESSSGGKDENIVAEELKAGYTLNGRLIRPAAVKIFKHKDEGHQDTKSPSHP
jgi:molecular chaperone GrpE